MSLDVLINKHYNNLKENDLFIWKYIQNNREACLDLSVDELAKHCNVSRTTILRFVKKISLQNYADLKLYLKMYCQEKESQYYQYSLSKVCDSYHAIINHVKQRDYKSIFEKIYTADRIFVYGTGNAQKSEARELKRIFLALGKCIYDLYDEGEVGLLLNTFTKNDLFFIISLSGETEEAIDICRKIKLKDVTAVSITRLKNNRLAGICDDNLYVATNFIEGLNYEITTLFYILFDILLIKYMEFEKGKMK